MAAWKYVIFAVLMFLTIISSAPSPTTIIDGVLVVPEECDKPGFCAIKPKGYDLLEKKMNVIINDFLRQANRTSPSTLPPKLSPQSDWDNCPSRAEESLWYLYKHGPGENKTDIIVQSTLFYQIVENIKCAYEHIPSNNGDQCFKYFELKALGMKSACETIHAYRDLYVYEPNEEKIVRKSYRIPICCACMLTQS